MSEKPMLITMGDPAGIGPEITIKALSKREDNACKIVVVGDLSVLRDTARSLNVTTELHTVEDPLKAQNGVINVIDLNTITPLSFEMGKPQIICAKSAYQYIIAAIDFALKGQAGAVITNPINKEALNMAGIPFQGHTELFAHRTKVSDYSMIFQLENLAVAHVTTHCSLKDAITQITEQRVFTHIQLIDSYLKQTACSPARIAVGGLNPHAGENGLFGTEESQFIGPAIARAQNQGIDVSGPYPPDTVFMRAFSGEFNGVVSMLHDHGFVALKSRDFYHGVNITIGLPIIRTSVGHGTAFDIAGKGVASKESLLSAIAIASKICRSNHHFQL